MTVTGWTQRTKCPWSNETACWNLWTLEPRMGGLRYPCPMTRQNWEPSQRTGHLWAYSLLADASSTWGQVQSMVVWLLDGMLVPDAGGVSTTGIWQEILSAGQPIKPGKSLESEQEQETVPCFGRDWGDVRMWGSEQVYGVEQTWLFTSTLPSTEQHWIGDFISWASVSSFSSVKQEWTL